MPSAFALLSLITSSYLFGACTGTSAVLSPFRSAVPALPAALIDRGKPFNRGSAIATSSVNAARAEAGIVCSVGRSCRGRARCPCTVETL
jgi:hypothetical protein